ncbi:MAG: DNA topoisomerase IV subunit B, partial [Clostridia bacterium]|nr:DNA topoisomerase IV subunit B [Clostridia bacterium]
MSEIDEKEFEKATEQYGDSQIQVLEGLEAVRKRPGMYIGTTSVKGLHHLIYEIVDNSIDEALAGFCDEISVTLCADGSVLVEDDGRGVPAGINEKLQLPTLEVIFATLHAGGKFGGGGYAIAGGLHGVGASVVNALSEKLVATNHRDGKTYRISFSKGKTVEPFSCIGETDRHGLTVQFWPDGTIFETTEFDTEIVRARLREQAFLNAGVKLVLKDEREPGHEPEIYCYEGGIKSFVEYLNSKKACEIIHRDVIYVSGKKGTSIAEVAMQYNDTYNETLLSFANNMHTVEGGTHETGFKSALTKVFNDYGRKYNILKPDEKLQGEDTREGLTAVISVKLEDAQFESQTKAKLGNSEVRTLVEGIMTEKLTEYFEENP